MASAPSNKAGKPSLRPWCGWKWTSLLPATAVLAVVVVVAVALVVVPFLVPVTNSIWRERGKVRAVSNCLSTSFCRRLLPGDGAGYPTKEALRSSPVVLSEGGEVSERCPEGNFYYLFFF